MAGKPVTIGTMTFLTQGAAETFIRTNVISAFDGAPRIPAGPIHEFVEDLLNLHEEAVSKIGVGIDYFRVDAASAWKVGVPVRPSNRTLVVVRTDGTAEDWSWTSVVTKPSAITQIRTALRNAVYDDIQATKRNAFAAGPVICPRTGLPILKPEDAQVRYHAPTFARITADFAATVGGWSTIATTSTGAGAELSDPLIKGVWRAYYVANAVPSIEQKY